MYDGNTYVQLTYDIQLMYYYQCINLHIYNSDNVSVYIIYYLWGFQITLEATKIFFSFAKKK
jgi:hypothetical protein